MLNGTQDKHVACVQVLRQLPEEVIPHMSDPVLLSEFLTGATDAGGFTAHLALQSLFLLLTQHGLEYPRFYERLYGLLMPTLFQVCHVCMVSPSVKLQPLVLLVPQHVSKCLQL